MILSSDVQCPACKGMNAIRINRKGFLQRNVLSLLGLYPWKCGACGVSFFYRNRGHGSRLESRGSAHRERRRGEA